MMKMMEQENIVRKTSKLSKEWDEKIRMKLVESLFERDKKQTNWNPSITIWVRFWSVFIRLSLVLASMHQAVSHTHTQTQRGETLNQD